MFQVSVQHQHDESIDDKTFDLLPFHHVNEFVYTTNGIVVYLRVNENTAMFGNHYGIVQSMR